MIYNDASLSFEVTSRTKTNIHTNIQFSTQDIDTARLIFTLTKDGVPLPLSAVSGKLVMYMADGSRFIKNVEIVDPIAGVAQYVLTSDEIKHYGTVNAELNLYYANKQALSVHKFSFVIDRALVDTDIVPVAEYYIDDFEALVAKVNELYDEAIATMEELRQKFSDLENIETKTGAQEKADKAEANAKAYTDVHANNKTIHITADERTTWNAKETTSGSQSKADKALGDAKAYTDTHANRTDNPHGVTKAQIGLANVSNVAQAAKTDFDTHVSDTVKHITADERTKWNGSQLLKITNDVGNVLVSAGDTDDFYTKITQSGRRF
ncbi:phage baseplate upper protein, partial [Bacillus subtilis]